VTLACGVRYVVIALANFVIKQEMDTQASKQRYRTVPQWKLRYQCVILDCQPISVSNFLDVPLRPPFLSSRDHLTRRHWFVQVRFRFHPWGRTIYQMSEVAWSTTLLVSDHKRKAHTTLMKCTDLIQRFIIHQLLSSKHGKLCHLITYGWLMVLDLVSPCQQMPTDQFQFTGRQCPCGTRSVPNTWDNVSQSEEKTFLGSWWKGGL
jgi:hypothetical protein